MNRELGLGCHSELDNPLIQLTTAGSLQDTACLCDVPCSSQLLKKHVAGYSRCFALAGSPPH